MTALDTAHAPGGQTSVDDLRRVDWRFLLPDPCLGVTALLPGADPALLTGLRLVSSHLEQVPDEGMPGRGRTCDTVVVSHPGRTTAATAAALLREGGWAYVEVPAESSPLLTARRVRQLCRELEAAGFDAPRRHWHVPSFSQAGHVVPLDEPVALLHLARRNQGTRAGLLRGSVLRATVHSRTTALAAQHVSVVARRPAGRRGDDPAPTSFALALAAEHGVEAPTQVLVTPRFRTSRHIVSIVLDGRTGKPALVVKVPRAPHDSGGVVGEARILRRLASLWPDGAGSFPSVVALHTGTRPALVESALPGRTLTHAAVARSPVAAVRSVGRWLAALPVTGSTAADPTWWDRLVEAPLLRLAAQLPPELGVTELVRATLAIAEPLRHEDLPLVLEHGDATCPNLLVTDDGDVAAVDWELAEEAGLPGTDLLHFLAFVAFATAGVHDAPGQVAAFERAFSGPRPWAADVAAEHLRARGVDPRLLGPLMAVTWARYAAHAVPRLTQLGEVAGQPGRLLSDVVRQDRDVAVWRSLVARLRTPGSASTTTAEDRP